MPVKNIDAEQVTEGFLGLIIRLYDNPFVSKLIAVLIALAVVIVLMTISKIISAYIRNRIMSNFVIKDGEEIRKVGTLVGDVVFYAMTMFSLFIGFNIVGINIGYLMGGISIGIGFAFRETLSNMISGIVIFSTKEYQLGNIVELRLKGQILGRIEEITMRHIIIRTFDLRRVVVPNSKFLKQPVKTYSEEETLRYEMEIPVDISLDIQKAIKLVQLQVNSFEFVINKEFTQVLVESFTDKIVKFRIIFSFDPNAGNSTLALKSAINASIIDLFKQSKKEAKTQVVA